MSRGFVTIATGNHNFYRIAANLLRSYRCFAQKPEPFAVICDGERQPDAMRAVGCSEKRLLEILRAAGRREEDVFLLTLDGAGKTNLIPKDGAVAGRHGGKGRRICSEWADR